MLTEQVVNYKKSQIKQWPVRSNRASEIGHPCEKYLVFLRTRWQEKSLHDVALQFIFDEGRMHEDAVIATLIQAGLRLVEQQRAFEWSKYQVTGHIDAKVLVGDKAIPLEIKSSSPFVFNAINSVQDLFNGKYVYLKKYPAQMTFYMLMDNKDEGLFLFKNKVNGQLKEIPMTLDYGYGESLIQKAERINRHVESGSIPDPIEWSEEVCGGCGFAHVCMPEVRRDALEITDMPELEAKLRRWDELKATAKEYAAIDKEVKELFKGKESIVIGNYYISGKSVERKAYSVPGGSYWKTNIECLNVKGASNE